MNYTKPIKNNWNSTIYRPEGSDRSGSIRPVVRSSAAPAPTESMTLAEIVALATKRAHLAGK